MYSVENTRTIMATIETKVNINTDTMSTCILKSICIFPTVNQGVLSEKVFPSTDIFNKYNDANNAIEMEEIEIIFTSFLDLIKNKSTKDINGAASKRSATPFAEPNTNDINCVNCSTNFLVD
jgi:hypothetical protein